MTSALAPTTPPITLVLYADPAPDIEVLWGEQSIDVYLSADADLAPEDEAWLGHA
jgi:hypothetical protein